MALGGGVFTNYNKVLPGTYINFVSAANASGNVADRGVCCVAMELGWGKEGEIFAVTAEEFLTDCMKYFGYAYTNTNLKPIKELFLNASKVYFYRLGQGIKASCELGEAVYGGVCGNNIKIKVNKNIDDNTYFDVATYYHSIKKDVQKVKSASELTDNDYVKWDKEATLNGGSVSVMAGGSNATATGADYQTFLEKIENLRFNVLAVATEDNDVNNLMAAFTKRMREERGIKFQSVLYKCQADDIGVINVDTPIKVDVLDKNVASFVWFVAGATAGCGINKSLTNKLYNGVYTSGYEYSQSELEEGIGNGKFILHSVDGEVRILNDINSLVTLTSEVGEAFCDNQTVRTIDQIAYDDAKLFKEKYLGVVPNDEAGRISLWNDLVEHRRTLQKMRAIENFKDEDIVVEKGSKKTSVVITSAICPVNSMAQLYITTEIE